MSQRQAKVEELLRHELANILQFEMRDPRVRLATVLHLRVSRDLSHAEVGISVLGDEAEREACVRVLERAKGFIRSTLARRVGHGREPSAAELEHSQRITDLLEDLNEEDT